MARGPGATPAGLPNATEKTPIGQARLRQREPRKAASGFRVQEPPVNWEVKFPWCLENRAVAAWPSADSAMLTADGQTLDKRFRQARFTHALLHRDNIVLHAPEFDDLMFEIGDGKSSTRLAIARLAYRAGIQ